jgi:DNA polymerase-3 subunit alpha
MALLAYNKAGYANLLKIVSKSHLEGFYYKPRADYGLLRAHSEGLIALSGCLNGHIPRLILSENEEELKKYLELQIEIFGKENYFLEMQDHPLVDSQQIVNERLKKLSKQYGVGLVVTNDSHYPRPEDSEAHDILLCIQTQTTVQDENRMRYVGDFSMRDINDIRLAFPDCPEAIDNTLKIAERCNVDFEFGVNLLPSFDTPQNEKPEVYLRRLCEEGLALRFKGKSIPENYLQRLDYELATVHSMGFDTYFLIVYDFVRYARECGIVVGPGRGSAAGSILAWSLRITDLDPIEYGLFFERFLNPERVSMPDIDIDFADNRRDEVLAYVTEKYGRDKVAQIITFGTMAPRAAVRDVGRALGYPYFEVDKLAKIVPPPILGNHIPLKVSIVENADLKKEYENNPRAKALLDFAMKLEGTVRHAGTHACAVVISEKPLNDYTALQYGSGGSNEVVTQYSMKPIEKLGLLKMDFLGLKNLTVIENTSNLLKLRQNIDLDITSIPLNDDLTFELLKRADTTGVFQLESSGMRRYLKDLKPNKFDDIVAMGALYRPGPMEWIPTYIKGKHNPEKVKYLHKSFKPILETTYGVAIFQEQILQLARDFAGFSLGEADILRKAVGKKIASLLTEQKEKFIKGAVKNGYDKKFANEVFEKVIEPFAGYGFNKAHAVCYGMIAYQTAYLKAHYPLEFMTALLCSDAHNTERVVLEIKECNDMGIDVKPPSINESFGHFAITDKNQIRFGLLAIKGLGDGPINQIIEVREKSGPFKSLEDFALRVPSKILNKKLIQALAYSGAFDDFGDRNQIAENYDNISKFAKISQVSSFDGQTSIFGMMEESEQSHSVLKLEPFPMSHQMQRLKWEKELLGMYVSGHPLRGLKKYIAKKALLMSSLSVKKINKPIQLAGIVSSFRKILTKTGSCMATFVLEDPTAKINVVMFPRQYSKFGTSLAEDQIVVLGGKLDYRRGQFQVMADSVKTLSVETMISNAKESGLYDANEKSELSVRFVDDLIDGPSEDLPEDIYVLEIPSSSDSSTLQSLNAILIENKGETPVELIVGIERKKIRLPFGVSLSDNLRKSVDSLLK